MHYELLNIRLYDMKRTFGLGVLALFLILLPQLVFAAEGDVVKIVYSGSTASVTIPTGIQSIVSASVEGANVSITSTTLTEEYVYDVSGISDNGSLIINGAYKLTLKLSGVSLHSNTGAAIDVECGKRVAVILADGTENTLSDGVEGLNKAALYFTGHPEFEGAGILNVTGNTKHAISAKEYLQLKKSTGVINVLGAVSDGIHCGKGKVNNANNFFQINGGTVNISNVGGDCIDSDDFGSMLIKGGTMNLTVADGGRGLKCDSVLTMVDGVLNIDVKGQDAEGIRACYKADFQGGSVSMNVSGNGSKGIKAKNDNETVMDGGYASFGGTDVDIKASGSDFVDEVSGDVSKCMCISVDKDMTQTAGDILLTLGASTAKAYNVKGEMQRTGGTFTIASDGIYNVNPADFQYDMSAYVKVSIDGAELQDYSTYLLGAFCGDVCCGVAKALKVGDSTCAYIRVYSNSSKGEVTFRLMDMVSGQVRTSDDVVNFQVDGSLGTPSSPYLLSFTTIEEYKVSVASADEAMGTVTGSGTFVSGTQVTVEAKPQPYYLFKCWMLDGVEVSTDASYTFTVTSNVKLVAVFYTTYAFIPDYDSTGKTGNEDFTKIFDGSSSTKWGFVFSPDTYVVFHPTSDLVANSYSFTTANDNEQYKGRNPYSWTIYGSNSETVPTADSETWEQIAHVSEDIQMEDKNFTPYAFPLDVTGNTYRYYKLVIHSLANASFCQFSEFVISSDVVAPVEQEGDFIVDASSERLGGSEGAVKAFDGKTDTKWGFFTSDNSTYVIFHANAEDVNVNSYTIVTGGDNELYTGRNPKSWTLYACDAAECPAADSDLWQPIATVTADTTMEDKNNASYTFPLDVEHCTCRYYMLVISENQGSNYCQMSEFSLGWDQDIEDCLSGVASNEAAVTVYSLSGVRTSSLQRGVNIVCKADGSVTKVAIR